MPSSPRSRLTHSGWFVLLALQSVACRRSGADAREHDRPIELLVTNDAETLDPRYVTDAVGMRTTRLIHAGLVRLDPDTLAPIPYLARAWTWIDARTLEVTLRDDVHFHSGAPLKPNDVVATLQAFQSKAVGSRHATIVEAIETVVADGRARVRIELRHPHATLLTDLELPILRADEAFSPPAPLGTLDGLGPYRVAHVQEGEILLVPTEASVLPTPRHSAIIRTVHDENARALRLLGGRADIGSNVISPTLLTAMEETPGLAVASRPGANLTYMVVRLGRTPMSDLRFRRAVSMGIDRAEIARTLFAGRASPANTLVPPGHWAYAPPSTPFVFDPGAARRAVDEAGLTGTHVSLLTSTDRLRMSVARFMAQELEDVGLHVDVTPLELGTLIARLSAGDFDLATLQLPELAEPNVLRVFLHSARIPPLGSNRGRVRDPELDHLLDLGDEATGLDARRAVYAAVEKRLRDELFIVPLWHEDQVVVTSPRARAFLPSCEGRWLAIAALP